MGHTENTGFLKKRIIIFSAAFLFWILGIFLASYPLFRSFFLISWLLAGYPVIKNTIQNFFPGGGFRFSGLLDENFLMSAATIGAFAIGEWEEAAGVMIFYMVGELIQEAAVGKSRSSINALLALKPDKARITDGDGWKEIAAEEVNPGSMIMVRPGERIPLDGIITEGKSSVDLSMLTGESKPLLLKEGDEVRSGTVSLDGILLIKTTKSAGDSSAAKIIELVQAARDAKAKPERFISAFARVYTPLVVGSAVLLAVLPPLLIPGAVFSDWLYRALILLVISCPCALVVSIPLGYFAGIGGMSRRGIMVKGALHLDSLGKVKYAAFDKTGTLTNGKFSIVAVESAPGISKINLIESAVLAERESNHPIARAIIEEFGRGKEDYKYSLTEIAGQGVELEYNGTRILAGNRRLMESHSIDISFLVPNKENADAYTQVYIARNSTYMGRILIGDALKEGAAEAIKKLNDLGIKSTMLTGDTHSSATEAALQLGINSVEAELLPVDKLEKVDILAKTGITAFIGDGINDAPVLARSHVGIAMGGGADVAVEAADVIIMTDDPGRVPEAILRARKTQGIIAGNVAFALAAKTIFIILAGFGLANMWIALFADVGVALIAILNSTRALR